MTTFLYPLAILLCYLALPLRAAEGWLTHLETAQNVAQHDHRLILVDFWATWCGPCKMMDAEVWSDPDIQREKQKFVPLKIDVDHDPATAGRYRVKAMPTIMILDSFGGILYQHVGYLDTPTLKKLLSSFPTNTRSLNLLHQQASDSEGNPYTLLALATAFQEYGAALTAEAQEVFLERSDTYFRQVIKNSRPTDTLLLEKAELLQSLNDALAGRPKRSIKTVEKKIGLDNVSRNNLPVAYYVLICSYLRRGDEDQARTCYRTLRQTKGSQPYVARLQDDFEW